MITLNVKTKSSISFEELPDGAWFYQPQEDGTILLGIRTLPFGCKGINDDDEDVNSYNAVTKFIGVDDDDEFKDFLPDYCPCAMRVIQINTVNWE